MLPVDEYYTVSYDCTLRDALQIMKKSLSAPEGQYGKGRRTVLVYGPNNKLAGALTFRSVLEAVEPPFFRTSYTTPGFFEGIFSSYCQQQADRKVHEVMIPAKEIVVREDETILKAIHVMLVTRLGTLPVVNSNGRVVGMVRSTEIFQEITDLICGQSQEEDARETLSCSNM